MKGVNPRYALGTGVLVSFGLHALAVAGLSTLPRPATLSPDEWVEVSIADKTLTTPALPPEPDSDSNAERPPSPAPRSPAASPPQPPARSKPDAPSSLPETSPEPLDLTGTTLTAEGGGWAAQPGNGRASRGPIRMGRARAGGRTPAPETNPKTARSKPSITSAASLATPPRAPNLNATLAQNYPAAARARGIGGDAVVRVRIGPNGHVTSVSVISESFPGFGAACRATVLGSVWTAPLDASGKCVGTVVRYRCRFRVES